MDTMVSVSKPTPFKSSSEVILFRAFRKFRALMLAPGALTRP
jgi:hypothetical protein